MWEKIDSSASKAFGRIDKVTGSDVDLDVYSKMDIEAFKELAAQYGEEVVQGYIQDMEYKRLKNAQGT